MQKPLDLGFNIAVRSITARLFPCGFDVTADESAAPSTLDALKAHIAATGRMLVWSGASERTIFDDLETNWAFRAWHDWAHWRHDLPFTMSGEREVCRVQQAHLAAVYGDRPQLSRWQKLVYIEVVSQAAFQTLTGQFVRDQMAFTKERLAA